MHPRRTLMLPIVLTLVLTSIARADDKNTIENLKRENAELRKQLDRERDVSKQNELKARLAAEEAVKERDLALKRQNEEAVRERSRAEENAKLAAQAQKIAELAAKEAAARREEAKQALEAAEKRRAEQLKAVDEAAQLKVKSASLEVELQLHKKRLQELERRIVELEKSNALGKNASALEKPTDDLRGQVTGVTPSGIIVVSIGHDAGLKVGQSMFVYRVGKDSRDGKFLGTVKITKVDPKQSLGQFTAATGEKTTKPDIGDQATTVERK